jgi:hypothetical protein
MVRRICLAAFVVASVFAVVAPARAAESAEPTPRIGQTSLPPVRAAKYSAQALPTPAYPYADTFKLHSRPGSQRVIYLDFDGETVSGTKWNEEYNANNSFHAAPYDVDGNTASFSEAELAIIQSAWQRVAEDYAPFAVDVTTQDPGLAAIDRSSLSDAVFGTRALITNTNVIYGTCGCAGVGFIGVFDAPAPYHQLYQPAFVFGKAIGAWDKDLADAISHEVGHNLGLEHDGDLLTDYYLGAGAWAPIMGAGYEQPITQFSKGEYLDALNGEDDFAVMQEYGLPLRPDDHGNSIDTATAITNKRTGVVHTDADVDVFSFTTPGGTASWTAAPAPRGPNLDIKLELLNNAGTVLASSDPLSSRLNYDSAAGLSASLNVSLAAGTYGLRVQGVGAGLPLIDGYTGYGSVGYYTLSGVAAIPAPPTISVNDVEVSEGGLATFTVSLDKTTGAPVYFNAATSPITASPGSDYTHTSGQLSIPAGKVVKTFSVQVMGDTAQELAESFSVVVSNVTNATVGDGTGIGTILDDDTFGFSVTDVVKLEGGSGTYSVFTFTVSLPTAALIPQTVVVTTGDGGALAPLDYFLKSRIFSFAIGEKSKSFTVTVKGDNTPEANERFYVHLSAPIGGAVLNDAKGVGYIKNDDA